jgi:hypothetical protein
MDYMVFAMLYGFIEFDCEVLILASPMWIVVMNCDARRG